MENESRILVQIQKYFGVVFELDATIKYNLLPICFMDTFREDEFTVYIRLSKEQIVCKDGKSRLLGKIRLNFDIEEKKYSEIFYIDKSICSYCTDENKIRGILGSNFIERNKDIIYSSK